MNKLVAPLIHSLIPLAALAALPACLDTEEEPGTEPAFGPPLGGKENNGPHVLGAVPDAIPLSGGHHFRVSTSAMRQGTPVTVNVERAYLKAGTHVKADPWFNGTVFTHPAGASSGKLRIDSVVTSPDSWSSYYVLSYNSNGASPNWVPYCGPGQVALPLHGAYQADDIQVARTGEITFACQDGAAFKCTSWGYDGGVDQTSAHWLTRTACVQAVEAAYDGDGTSFTVAGTPIHMRDVTGSVMPALTSADLQSPTSLVVAPPPGVPYFEAAWQAATYAGGASMQGAPLCLSKQRWASLEIGSLATLTDPRIDPDGRFCEDWTWPEFMTAGAFFTRSEYLDTGLWIWRNNGRRLTTVDGFWSVLGGDVQAPLTGYGTAVLDSVLLRGVPPGSSMANLTEIRLYKKGLDYALARTAPPGFASYGSFQGYVWNQPVSNAVPLVLYVNTSTGRYFTSSTVAAPSGFNQAETLGWIFPPR